MLAGICAVKCRLSAMPPATKEVVSWGNFFFLKEGKSVTM